MKLEKTALPGNGPYSRFAYYKMKESIFSLLGKLSPEIKFTLIMQASDRRDALAKFIYASLFDWLVEQLNKSVQVGANDVWRSISILDIYGFETFQV